MPQPDIHLYTAATMNGHKPAIFLADTRMPCHLNYNYFHENEQYTPVFVTQSPH